MEKTKKRIWTRIMIHLVAWIVLLGLPYYSMKRFGFDMFFLLSMYAIITINGMIFYINYLILVPRFFFQKKKYKYYLSAFALIVCFFFVTDLAARVMFRQHPGKWEGRGNEAAMEQGYPGEPAKDALAKPGHPFSTAHIMGYGWSSLFLVFFSLGLRVLERQSKIEKIQEELELERLNSELAFLKNQINPHFFFNTLNNIYSLIGSSKTDSREAVLKLSKLMRYLLYESEQGKTLLSQEISFMGNYIDLMKLRTSDKVKLNVDFPESVGEITIEPLLFIPFIENAFKHGISYREKSFIDISMELTGSGIIFRCSNSMHKGQEDPVNTNHKGIGLENVKKRLNLLFPAKHELKINQTDDRYDVTLEIDIK